MGPTAWRRRAEALLVLALVAAGCGGGDGGPVEADGPDGSGAAGAGDAVLGVLDPGVDVADEPDDPAAATFRAGQDGESLVVADVVRTDVSGFAEVVWFDGALARVDADSRYVLTELDATPGSAVVETRLEVGRVWNRLREDVVERYEVTTDVATAAVRGTAFWVACVAGGPCTFVVLEGTVLVTAGDGTQLELRAGQQVTVDATGVPGEVEPADRDDPWVVTNDGRDTDDGFDPLPDPEGPDDDGGLAAGDDPCPFVALPDGWTEAPTEESEAVGQCRLVNDTDDPASFAAIQPVGGDTEQFRDTIEQNRPFYEQFRDEITSSSCADGMREELVIYDETLGAGELYGFAWQVLRGPLPEDFGECTQGIGNSGLHVVIDGRVWRLQLPEVPSGCVAPLADQEDGGAWQAYQDCVFDLFAQRQESYRELAGTLLGE